MEACLSKGRLSVSEEASRYVSSWSPTKDTLSPFARPIALGNVLCAPQVSRLAALSYRTLIGMHKEQCILSVDSEIEFPGEECS